MFSWSQPKAHKEPASRTRSGRLLHQKPPGGQQNRNILPDIMVTFDKENGQDPDNIHTKLQSITLEMTTKISHIGSHRQKCKWRYEA